MLKLAVIGGGPSAACVVEAVAGHIAPIAQVDMTVFEPGPNLWRGQVFQRDGDEVLANVPMVEMSARAWDREHGVRWLREHGLGRLAAETVFPSRSLVGRYFQDAAGAALAVMRARGSRARVEAQAVRALVRDEGQLWAHGEGGEPGRSTMRCCAWVPRRPMTIAGWPGQLATSATRTHFASRWLRYPSRRGLASLGRA
jgi:uncharacterized NAD(P)/FAD-binding protein YdhS